MTPKKVKKRRIKIIKEGVEAVRLALVPVECLCNGGKYNNSWHTTKCRVSRENRGTDRQIAIKALKNLL